MKLFCSVCAFLVGLVLFHPSAFARQEVLRPSIGGTSTIATSPEDLILRLPPPGPQVNLTDAHGKRLETVMTGSNVIAMASGLTPGKFYDIFLRDEAGHYVSMLRLTADRNGNISPSILLYQSGVVGAGNTTEAHLKLPYRSKTFEEAEDKLTRSAFTMELRDGEKSLVKNRLSFAPNTHPYAYPSDREGHLLNSLDRKETLYLTGRNFDPGAEMEIFLVPHQGRWHVGERITEVRKLKEPQRVVMAEKGRTITIRLAAGNEVSPGEYDIIVRTGSAGHLVDRPGTLFLNDTDTVTWNGDVGVVVYDSSHTHLVEQVAGKIVSGYPWFKYIDGFTVGTDVWGALDPKRKPIGHPGTFAAWYVVDHQNTWNSGDPLADVSGGFEITPIKPGCINATETLLWSNPNPANINETTPTRPYDVVIDFGNLSPDQGMFTSDNVYTEGIDFVDYRGAVGFYLVRDPRLNGSFQTADVEEPAVGSGCNLDLDGINITWTDPVFYPAQSFNVAIGDDDMGSEDGRCPSANNLVDMRAHVYYPKKPGTTDVADGGPFPVAVFYHGQQWPWSIPGYMGYEYMGSLLASHGFIVYSIDARPLLNATIASRGEHIRAHLRKLVAMNAMGSGSIFSQKMDLQKVAVAGHSRGGDAITAAYEWQRVQPDAGYAIKALIAIAPVQFFGPLGWGVEPPFEPHLRDVAYQIIHGSKDGDVADFQGLRMYDRAADPRQAGQTPKSMVFVKDANHNYYNSVWETQEGSDYGGGGLLSAADQRDTGKVYMHAFLQVNLMGRQEYDLFLAGAIPYPGTATVLLDYQAPVANHVALDHFEAIPPAVHDKNTNTANGMVNTPGIVDYEERQLKKTAGIPWSSYQGDTYGATLSWDNNADAYISEVTPAVRAAINPATTPYLSFRAGQIYRMAGSPNPAGLNQNFAVRLHDTDGNYSPYVYVNNFGFLPPPWDTTAWAGMKTVMGAVRIPIQAFTVNTYSLLDLSKIDKVEFDFYGSAAGEIAFDDIRFTK